MQDTPENDRAGAQAKETKRRLVKLAWDETMWLIEKGMRRPILESHRAAALGLPPEVIEEDELLRFAEGKPY